MTTINDINKSLSNMSSDELFERIRELRTARRVATPIPRHSKKPKKDNTAKLLGSMTKQQMADLIKQMEAS